MKRFVPLVAVIALVLALTPGTGAAFVDLNPGHHDRTVLVRVAEGVDPAVVHAAVGVGEVVNRLDEIGVDVVQVRPGAVASAVAAYKAASDVVYAEPNPIARPTSTPNDEFIDEWPYPVIDAFEGWAAYNAAVGTDFAPGGGATIAVLDTGIDLTHAEFAGKVADCRSYLTATGSSVTGCQDNHFHGTHVTGTAAAITNNEIGIAGIGFDADVMSLQICNNEAGCFYADAAAALIYAANNGADVANMSFGGPAENQTLADAVRYAATEGQMLLVGAAGNSGAGSPVDFPGRLPEVVAVGATDSNDQVASFSSRGPEVEVAAPGVSVLSTIPGPFIYLRSSGTSMASPHVAGLGALLMNLGLSAADARAAIVAGAELVQGATGHTPEYGHGRINVANSIALALAPDDEKKNSGKKGSPPGRPSDRPPR